MSPGRLWWLLRRDLKRGWKASYFDYRVRPRIGEWEWPYWHETPQTVPIHVLTGEKDWELCAWMLASWFHFTEDTWRVCIHDDGTLPSEAQARLLKLFPQARIISRDDADARMDKLLAAFPLCHDYRNRHPLALKIFDIPALSDAKRIIVLDSDVLFFSYPHEIMHWVVNESLECWFNADVAEGSLISEKDARDDLAVKLWPKVNSGLCLLVREALDLEFCEKALGETNILQGHIWRVEQTLYALCASRFGRGGLLPPTYEVSLRKNAADTAIARHYVGAVRDRFYAEGIKRLHPVLLAPERK